MRKSKIGDVYSYKTVNGYKLFQRAYDVPRTGRFVRVFDGIYATIPDNIAEIVFGPHSYIIDFFASRAYRIGLIEFVGNYPVPEKYPFPEFSFKFEQDACGNIIHIAVRTGDFSYFKVFRVSKMEELPEEFRKLKLINVGISPDWFLFLLDTNWNLSNLAGFYPGRPGEDFGVVLDPYCDIVNSAMNKEQANKLLSKEHKPGDNASS